MWLPHTMENTERKRPLIGGAAKAVNLVGIGGALSAMEAEKNFPYKSINQNRSNSNGLESKTVRADFRLHSPTRTSAEMC